MTKGDAVLEATFLGPELRFTADALVAVTGAELPPKVDGMEQPTWTAFAVRGRPDAQLRVPEIRRPRLHRRRRRD